MPRGVSFSKVLTFFREGNEDEVRAILPLVIEAAGQRHITIAAGPAERPQRPMRTYGTGKRRKSFDRTASAKKAWATRRLNTANGSGSTNLTMEAAG